MLTERFGKVSLGRFRRVVSLKNRSALICAGNIAGQKTGTKNFSSIPSKFETTLFTGKKERDGFGSRAHRFVENEVNIANAVKGKSHGTAFLHFLQNDLPGPGSYEEAVKLKDDKVYSKKGLGVGFVSQSKRESVFGSGSSAPGRWHKQPHPFMRDQPLCRCTIPGL